MVYSILPSGFVVSTFCFLLPGAGQRVTRKPGSPGMSVHQINLRGTSRVPSKAWASWREQLCPGRGLHKECRKNKVRCDMGDV